MADSVKWSVVRVKKEEARVKRQLQLEMRERATELVRGALQLLVLKKVRAAFDA